ncbi:hypothetical protein HYV49_04835 [Candidatus Pacearchaeota archaeon]|nr:hypothetical protein [Candidatus Pacearchaeota archaeon]
MRAQNFEIYYDKEADVLEIMIGNPTPSYFDEVDDDIFEGRDIQTKELKGFKIFNFIKKGSKLKDIKFHLPVNMEIKTHS